MFRARDVFALDRLIEELLQIVVEPDVIFLLFGSNDRLSLVILRREQFGDFRACLRRCCGNRKQDRDEEEFRFHAAPAGFGLTNRPATIPIPARSTAINPASKYDIPKNP